jgi:hypothetical protein
MVEGRDTNGSHSQQYFSVRDRWFWKNYELQPVITTEFFCSHCTHISFLYSSDALVVPRSLVSGDRITWTVLSWDFM